MTARESFDDLLERIEGLVTGRDQIRDFDGAYQVALQATQRFPAHSTGWSQLVLTANLTDRHGAALQAQVNAKAKCPSWTDIDDGDCERDHALYSICHRQFLKALQHLATARELHKSDPDRLALLKMVEGQWWFMLKNYGEALRCFAAATAAWDALETEADVEPPRPQWRFNSDRRLLKVVVALRGSRDEAHKLYESLLQRMDNFGSPDIAWRLRLVMTGRVGNWLDTRIESPMGKRLLTKLAPLARRLLPAR